MLRDEAPAASFGAIKRARKLRREMSLPEVLLWQVLRARPGGLKFRRQHPSGAYILDFFCSDARLAIEIDGEGHGRGARPKADERRDDWFKAHGIATLRLSAKAVLADLDAVVTGVVHACGARLPLHHPAARGGPPPRAKLGED